MFWIDPLELYKDQGAVLCRVADVYCRTVNFRCGCLGFRTDNVVYQHETKKPRRVGQFKVCKAKHIPRWRKTTYMGSKHDQVKALIETNILSTANMPETANPIWRPVVFVPMEIIVG